MSFDLHQPVLLQDVLNMSEGDSAPKFLLDGTFGRGGHAIELIHKYKGLKVCGLDQDLDAIEYANREYQGHIEKSQLQMVHGSFHNATELLPKFDRLNPSQFDLILLDLGVSSPQLDEADRGFSFLKDGPLDMRMNQKQSLTAAGIVNEWSEQELRDLFYHMGEVRKPGRVVSEIISRRKDHPFQSTLELSELIASTDGWRKKGWHPATQYFLALRMQVNQELEPLEQALIDLMGLLSEGGRFLVITFHSLEDRIVKQTFKASLNQGDLINKKVVQATWDEKKKNARSRSAKLRGFVRRSKKEES